MKKLTLLLLFPLLVAAAFAQQKPNIVFILADDLGYGDVGTNGQKQIKTPHLDKLAGEGMSFSQFYAGTSVCAPSRASLMTGRHTGHTPVRGNREAQPEGQFPLPDSIQTMAELLREAGYATGLFGKWGLGYPGSEGEPNRQGFDRFYGYNCQRQSHNFFPGHLWNNDQRVLLSNSPDRPVQYAPDLIQAKALEFITANKGRPFFLYLAYTLPHAGLQLPQGDTLQEHYIRIFGEAPREVPSQWDGKGYQPQPYPLATYAAMVGRLDRYIGEVVQKLQALGIDDNTLIVFTSDNGPHREGGNRPEYFNSSGGLRGIKRDLYEGGIRVPTIARWPQVIRAGRRSDFVGASWDFLPTFAELAGLSLSRPTDGLSLVPLLTGKGTQRQHDFLYWEFHEQGGRQAVRMGRWKGVRLDVKKDPDGPVQLFDLVSDPAETTDVSAAHPDIVREIRRIMQEQHVENEHFSFLIKQTRP